MKLVHISTIKHGDIVEHNGVDQTIGRNFIKFSTGLGWSIFGDGYKCGHQPVRLVTYEEASGTKEYVEKTEDNLGATQ